MAYESDCTSDPREPGLAEALSRKRRIKVRVGQVLAGATLFTASLYPTGEAVVRELTEVNKPVDFSNFFDKVSYRYALYEPDQGCLPAPDDDELEDLHQRKSLGLMSLNRPEDIADHFGLTIVDNDTVLHTIDNIEQATSPQEITGAINELTVNNYGFKTETYRPENFERPLEEYKRDAKTLAVNLSVIPVELYQSIELEGLIVADKVMSSSYLTESKQSRGKYYFASRIIVLSESSIAEYSTLVHEFSHAIHAQSCGGVMPRLDNHVTDLNPANYQYAGDAWDSVEIDPAFFVDNSANKNFREDFAVTGAQLFSDNQINIADYSDANILAVDKKRNLVEYRFDEVVTLGTAAYLDAIGTSWRKRLALATGQ